ncbi:hypothetical protein E6H12_11635 [Candidatus Bathyarchaeota archaeon]|nr:MAG: hypothetical protein E6H12_11635 [Candidatus Bathyarchaeota archaeon]
MLFANESVPRHLQVLRSRIWPGLGPPVLGAGVYATNGRLFIVGPGKASFPSTLNKIAPGCNKSDFVPSTLTMDQNNALIGTLIENRMFEFSRDQISQIELKRPGLLGGGWLKITSADGQALEIRITAKMVYEWAVRLVQAFKPEAVTLD